MVVGQRQGVCVPGSSKLITGVMVLAFSFGFAANASVQSQLLAEAEQAFASADPFMGDWQGTWTTEDGYESGPLVAQVIALGDNTYRANFHIEFEYEWPPLFTLNGRLENGSVGFEGRAEFDGNALDIQARIQGGKFKGKFKGTSDGQAVSGTLVMEKTIRLSPTLGAKLPKGAIELFNGKDFDQWQHVPKKPGIDKVEWILKDGAMEVRPRSGGIITKQKFGDVKLHLEFRTPFMPTARGQGRGNSGVYLQGRYEVQILDSYGLEGRGNECGGIYGVGAPAVNMCAPPTQWQTYDITFRAPRFNDNGEKIRGALLTVVHNGKEIQTRAEAMKPTTAAPDLTETGPGGVYLQDHGNPVQYRNIWLVELAPTGP